MEKAGEKAGKEFTNQDELFYGTGRKAGEKKEESG